MQTVSIQFPFKNVTWTVFQPFLKLSGEKKRKKKKGRKHIETLTYTILLNTETGNSNNVMGGTDNKAWFHVPSTPPKPTRL